MVSVDEREPNALSFVCDVLEDARQQDVAIANVEGHIGKLGFVDLQREIEAVHRAAVSSDTSQAAAKMRSELIDTTGLRWETSPSMAARSPGLICHPRCSRSSGSRRAHPR